MPKPQYRGRHVKARAELLADNPLCEYCDNVATVADHVPPLSQHVHVEGSGCCTYVPSCATCSSKQGGQLTKTRWTENVLDLGESEPTPSRSAEIWQVPWLSDLVELMPDDAVWPRYMSPPHPRATGTYLLEFTDWVRKRSRGRITFRWWQLLVATRLLEHDEAGMLVWRRSFFSVARQLGKSYLMRELLVWFTTKLRELTEGDVTLVISRQVLIAEKLIDPIISWTKDRNDWTSKSSVGRKEVGYIGGRLEDPDNPPRWLVRSAGATYGETVGLGVADECWDITQHEVDEGLSPTVLAAKGSLVFTSTAHRKATTLTLGLRREALRQIEEDKHRLLIMEWSTPSHYDIEDQEGWRLASPHWDWYREEHLEDKLDEAQNGITVDESEPDPVKAFEAQYLNRWPVKITRQGKGEAFLEPGQWANALVTSERPQFGIVVALEDHFGNGCSVAVAGMTASEKIAVTGRQFESHAEAIGWMAEHTDVAAFLVGASMENDPKLRPLGTIQTRGSTEIRSAIPRFRQVLRYGRLVHDGNPELADQVLEVRTRTSVVGVSFVPGPRQDFARAAVWAVEEVENRLSRQPQVH